MPRHSGVAEIHTQTNSWREAQGDKEVGWAIDDNDWRTPLERNSWQDAGWRVGKYRDANIGRDGRRDAGVMEGRMRSDVGDVMEIEIFEEPPGT